MVEVLQLSWLPKITGFPPSPQIFARSLFLRKMTILVRLRNSVHRWVLDADVAAAFDNISHKYILDRIGNIPGRALIKMWLSAGYVEEEIFHATTRGVQQGGVISPVLANIALDGLEQHLGQKFGYIRYADDFIVTARSKEDLEKLKPEIEKWLEYRGLTLNCVFR